MENRRVGDYWFHADTEKTRAVSQIGYSAETYTRYLNSLIAQGFMVTCHDGNAEYRVIGFSCVDDTFMQITYMKRDCHICDTVEYCHPVIVRAYGMNGKAEVHR